MSVINRAQSYNPNILLLHTCSLSSKGDMCHRDLNTEKHDNLLLLPDKSFMAHCVYMTKSERGMCVCMNVDSVLMLSARGDRVWELSGRGQEGGGAGGQELWRRRQILSQTHD